MTRSAWFDALAHHTWATDRLLAACGELSPDQLATPVPGTYGPIIATLRHLVATDGWYLSFFLEFENPIGEDDPDVTIEQLRAANTANGERWLAVLAEDRDPESDIVEHGDGWTFTTPLQFRYAQVGFEVLCALANRQSKGHLSTLDADRQVWKRLAA